MQYKEIEYKFWADSTKEEFHTKVNDALSKGTSPGYVVSCDDYYLRDGDEQGSTFVRFRKGGSQDSKMQKYELTLKQKENGNIIRKEINIDVSNNDDSAIVEFLRLSGYKKVHSIFKEAWVWFLEDCDLSYYTLSDGRSVIEIEAKEYSNKEEGVDRINDWTTRLGLDWTKREQRSLFEIFTQEKEQEIREIEVAMNAPVGPQHPRAIGGTQRY